MRMGIGLGVGINRSNYAQGIFNAYSARVVADGGVVESGSCVDAVSSLLQSASLLLIPSGYKGGKLYSEIPTNGNGDLTWTRGGDAFRTNESGVIQRVPWNLASYSDAFENVAWLKTNSSVSGNVTIAPNGTLTADKLVENSTNANHYTNQSVTNTNSLITYSIYAKASERNFLYVSAFATLPNNFGYVPSAYFDLTNGTLGTTSGCNASIVNVGNGWFRCIIQCTSVFASSSATVTFYNYTATANGINSYQGDGTSGIFIWGAQAVEGTTAQTYLPTTDRLNFPRLSYMYGSCPSALLEPQRTNLFVNSGWTGGGATPTNWLSFITGTTTPLTSIKNNSVTAYRFSGTSQRAFFIYGMSVTSGVSYSFSVYVESVTTAGSIDFMLSFANITGTATYYKNGVLTTSTNLIEAGNTYTMLFTPSVTTIGDFRIGMGAQGNATANYVLSMPQFEQGAYATTFILSPVSATATRVADSFSRSNIYTNGLISASGGTWFVELRGNVSYTRDTGSEGLFIGDTSVGTTNCLQISSPIGGGRLRILKRVAGTGTELYSTLTDTIKVAIKWNGTSADVFVNGTKRVSATAYTTTTMEFLGGLSADVPKFIQQMSLHPEPLTDAKLIELTTL